MKLRNKKTGKIVECECITLFEPINDNVLGESFDEFYTISELNEEWEDYEPQEPLIKDEKIRKAIIAWAKVNRDVSEVMYEYDTTKPYCEIVDNQSEARIRFNFLFINELHPYELYTIAELCGEEEE